MELNPKMIDGVGDGQNVRKRYVLFLRFEGDLSVVDRFGDVYSCFKNIPVHPKI